MPIFFLPVATNPIQYQYAKPRQLPPKNEQVNAKKTAEKNHPKFGVSSPVGDALVRTTASASNSLALTRNVSVKRSLATFQEDPVSPNSTENDAQSVVEMTIERRLREVFKASHLAFHPETTLSYIKRNFPDLPEDMTDHQIIAACTQAENRQKQDSVYKRLEKKKITLRSEVKAIHTAYLDKLQSISLAEQGVEGPSKKVCHSPVVSPQKGSLIVPAALVPPETDVMGAFNSDHAFLSEVPGTGNFSSEVFGNWMKTWHPSPSHKVSVESSPSVAAGLTTVSPSDLNDPNSHKKYKSLLPQECSPENVGTSAELPNDNAGSPKSPFIELQGIALPNSTSSQAASSQTQQCPSWLTEESIRKQPWYGQNLGRD